jgi:hypothetical protein
MKIDAYTHFFPAKFLDRLTEADGSRDGKIRKANERFQPTLDCRGSGAIWLHNSRLF